MEGIDICLGNLSNPLEINFSLYGIKVYDPSKAFIEIFLTYSSRRFSNESLFILSIPGEHLWAIFSW
ncbi:hypothetical protein D3C80_2114140 [compost metagenome]